MINFRLRCLWIMWTASCHSIWLCTVQIWMFNTRHGRNLSHSITKESQKTKITYFHIIWPPVDFGSTVDFSVKRLTKVNRPYYTLSISFLHEFFMFELLHHVRVLFNTTSRVRPVKRYQKTYTMSCGPNMSQNSEKEEKHFFSRM